MMWFVRAVWPIAFLIPLSWWADRGCAVAGVDPLYHTTVWIHERLGWFVLALAVLSAAVILWRVFLARGRLRRLLTLAESLPERVRIAFDRAAAELRVPLPRIAYLDVSEHVAATLSGPVILLSRGFAETLLDNELLLVARHEILHARRNDATTGVLWHLAFAALLLPGFEPLERRLHAMRERRANLDASHGREEAYLRLLKRMHGSTVCAGGRIGLEAPAHRRSAEWLTWVSPVVVISLAVALPLSHLHFVHDLPFLLRHHC